MAKICEITPPDLQLKIYRQAEEIQKLNKTVDALGKKVVFYDRIIERASGLLNSMPTGGNINDAATMLMSKPNNYVATFVIRFMFNSAKKLSAYAKIIKDKCNHTGKTYVTLQRGNYKHYYEDWFIFQAFMDNVRQAKQATTFVLRIREALTAYILDQQKRINAKEQQVKSTRQNIDGQIGL